METRVLIRSYPKPNAVNPLPQWCSWWNLIMSGQLVLEILMFESVDGRKHRLTHRPWLQSHTISSPWASSSGELINLSFKIMKWTGVIGIILVSLSTPLYILASMEWVMLASFWNLVYIRVSISFYILKARNIYIPWVPYKHVLQLLNDSS